MTHRLHLRARLDPALYRDAANLARVMGVPTNEFVVGAVRDRVELLKRRGGRELEEMLARIEGLQERLVGDDDRQQKR